MSTAASPATPSDRTRIRIHPERSVPGEIFEILRDGMVAHVAIADDGGPVVIPMTYYIGEEAPSTLYIHGGHHSRLMKHVASGAPICVTVTLVDGLVYSRTALYHSVNYRSAVCFGTAREVTDMAERRRVSEGIIARYFPGRTAGVDYAPLPDAHVEATAYVAVDITESSAKARRGGPKGPNDDDPSSLGSAGVITFDRAR
jgi:nitroimidazol reductase NimA-like FMN-containing flavoprotein (pyridoxamine 5'-phosphate oxidase superfamily)